MAAAERLRPSDAMEDYAKAIYALAHGPNGTVATTALAARLSVTPASASAMVKRLAERGLVEHVPYRGGAPHAGGRAGGARGAAPPPAARALPRRAPRGAVGRRPRRGRGLEHAISEDLEARIAAKLGHPTHDPHGDPIPDADLRIEEVATRSLADLEPGDAGLFVRVSDSDPEMLRYLDGRGVRLGDRLEVVERQPFDGPLDVRVGDAVHVLGGRLAAAMRVEADAG